MSIIKIDLEKLLGMIVSNADNGQNGLGNDDGVVIIPPLERVEYHYPSPGTYYPNCRVVDPEEFINIDEIEKEYSLDLVAFRTDAKDIVKEENGRDYDDFNEEDWDKVSGYINEWIEEWKKYARAEKRDTVEVEGKEFKIEWV